MLKAVIFDMDGVIIDSEPLHVAVVLDMLRDLNIGLSRNDILRFVGVSNSSMWKELSDEYAIGRPVDELVAVQHRRNIEVLNGHDDLAVPGVVGLLEEIKGNALKTAVASSSPREYIEAVLEKLGIARFFDAVLSGEEFSRGKPAPDIFLKTAEMLEVLPRECVVIEDSDNGVRAAAGAGMKVVGFRNPHSGSQGLDGADHVVDSIKEIDIPLLNKVAST